ncbi:hypothetical protein ES703_89272 [subsurface metagenome]
MAKDKFAQWFNMNKAVQAVADEEISVETLLPTNPKEGLVMAVHAIDFLTGMAVGIDGSWTSAHICTRPDLDMAGIMPGSPYLIAWIERATRGLTANGMSVYSPQAQINYPKPFLIAHPKLYLYAASSATTEVQTVRARILFTFEKVSTEEFFEALAAFGS